MSTTLSRAELLAIFDREQRRDIEFPNVRREVTPHVIRHVPLAGMAGGSFVLHSRLDETTAAVAIEEQIAYFERLGCDFEWKHYDHDTPADLLQRLADRGFEIEEAEAVCVLDLADAPAFYWQPVAAHDIRRITDSAQLADVAAVHDAVWPENAGPLAQLLAQEMAHDGEAIYIYVAYADGAPVCSAWIRFHTGTQFASLWGGSTLPAYRKRGIYSAMLAVRAQEARRRGFRFLTIDASPMSRPIVEKHGFQFLTFSHPCKWHVIRDS
ncbi:MAG: GNAT family N-acetyltransferase [Chloroflexi bacterium]|nr:GNAT family N-acetyltransferase [Chloroflexota bacterium]